MMKWIAFSWHPAVFRYSLVVCIVHFLTCWIVQGNGMSMNGLSDAEVAGFQMLRVVHLEEKNND